jgi:hypothetical protein
VARRRPARLTFQPRRAAGAHLQQLLSDDRYRLRMSAIQAQLQRAGGCTRAADIVEQALCQQQIVLAEAT